MLRTSLLFEQFVEVFYKAEYYHDRRSRYPGKENDFKKTHSYNCKCHGNEDCIAYAMPE